LLDDFARARGSVARVAGPVLFAFGGRAFKRRSVMTKSLTLPRYLARQYLAWFFIFLAGLAGIIYLFEVAELLRRAADIPDATFGIVLRMGLYKMPDTIEKVLPFVVLFAGMFTFWRLTRSQELVIARASGVSAWQFLAPSLLATFLFASLNVTLINPLGAVLNGKYRMLEAHYLQRSASLELTGAGLWLRQEEGAHRYLLHADRVETDPLRLVPVIVFIYDRANVYQGRVDAPKATLENGAWTIPDAWVNADDKMPEHRDVFTLPTTLTLKRIQESMAPPNTISFWKLPRFINTLHAIGLPATRHELAFQTLLAEPVLLSAMIFFAAAFSLRLTRRGGILKAAVLGLFTGGAVFSLNSVITEMGANQSFPIGLAAWAVPLLALVAGPTLLLHLEEGSGEPKKKVVA
jgi:lipopolysaccharide export system permease protein